MLYFYKISPKAITYFSFSICVCIFSLFLQCNNKNFAFFFHFCIFLVAKHLIQKSLKIIYNEMQKAHTKLIGNKVFIFVFSLLFCNSVLFLTKAANYANRKIIT